MKLLKLLACVVLASLLVGQAASASVRETWGSIEDEWPEEVPTPWFCAGHPPAYVCVPPIGLIPEDIDI